MDDEGYVYVVGRLSHLIIRGGTNISPAEVERVLRDHDNVADVAVVGLPDEVYGQRVVAAIVPDGQLDEADLHAFAAAKLTSHKPKRPRDGRLAACELNDRQSQPPRKLLRCSRNVPTKVRSCSAFSRVNLVPGLISVHHS
jgi:acyl-CoA synthetase (AMP-forming)/AMP-acid ligase II